MARALAPARARSGCPHLSAGRCDEVEGNELAQDTAGRAEPGRAKPAVRKRAARKRAVQKRAVPKRAVPKRRGAGRGHRPRPAGYADRPLDPVRGDPRFRPGRHRRHRGQRRVARDRPRPARRLRRPAVDRDRIHPHARFLHPARRLARRPVRPSASLRHRCGVVRTGSAARAFAPNIGLLVAARALQGVGAGRC